MSVSDHAGRSTMRRFGPVRIFEHGFHILLFGLLVCTGLSQKYYESDLSFWLIVRLGGVDAVRLIHRFAGLAFSIAVFAHAAAAIFGVAARKWRPSLVIVKKDFDDAVHNIRYYIGQENRPAAGDRYTYKQKFEYWGILTGGLLMIVTGMLLWRPLLVTRFMPGEIIPAAKVLHSNEALVVFLIIAVWHIYNAIFSPEVFPLNTSIFTGSLSRERMVEEHLIELARIEGKSPEDILREEIAGDGKTPSGPDF